MNKRTHIPKTWAALYDRMHKWIVVAVIVALTVGPLVAQYGRIVDQGSGANAANGGWPMRFCDTSGNCITLVLVGANYVVPVTVTSGSVTVTGTTTITGTVSATSGTINSMPSVSVTSGTIGSMPSMSVTSGTIGSITMPSLTVTSGTIGSITMPALTFTSGTVTNTVADNIAQVLGAAMSTANPLFDGGRSSTDTTGTVANGGVITFRVNKMGDLITALAPFDLMGFGTTSVTATTAAQILASSGGANYRWAITSVMTCNLSGVVATQLDVTDSSGTLFSFPWTQTATTAGEARCYMQQFPTPYISAANSTISVKLTTSNATGVRTNITAYKTGT